MLILLPRQYRDMPHEKKPVQIEWWKATLEVKVFGTGTVELEKDLELLGFRWNVFRHEWSRTFDTELDLLLMVNSLRETYGAEVLHKD